MVALWPDREEDIAGIRARDGSPAWLVEETEAIKEALMKLRHNVVLLRDMSNPLNFTPVCLLPLVGPCSAILHARIDEITTCCFCAENRPHVHKQLGGAGAELARPLALAA